jgi:DNA-binding CsgD family transcriptional regulator
LVSPGDRENARTKARNTKARECRLTLAEVHLNADDHARFSITASYRVQIAKVERLTARQRQIAELIADGHTDKAIQARLRISRPTLRVHLNEIAHRLNLDHTKNLRVQVTWLVVDHRYEDDPDYQLPLPVRPRPHAA